MILSDVDLERAKLILDNPSTNFNVLLQWKNETTNINLQQVIQQRINFMEPSVYISPNPEINYRHDLQLDIIETENIQLPNE